MNPNRAPLPPAPAPPSSSQASNPPNLAIPPLQNASPALQALREHARRELAEILSSAEGLKTVIVDSALAGPLQLVLELHREPGVELVGTLSEEPVPTDSPSVFFIVRPSVESMRMVAQQVRSCVRRGLRTSHSLFFVPRATLLAEKALEEEGVFGELTIGHYSLDLVLLEDDVLSLELPDAFRDCFLDGDRSALYDVANALLKLQLLLGTFPVVQGVGPAAVAVNDVLRKLGKELELPEAEGAPEIGRLVLVDRTVDLVTPMATQLTFEGLVDEVFGIQQGFVELDAEMVQSELADEQRPQPLPGERVQWPVNSSDAVFLEMRDLNFTTVKAFLHRKGREIEDFYELRKTAKSMSEFRDFTKRLGPMQLQHRSLEVLSRLSKHIDRLLEADDFARRLATEQHLFTQTDVDVALEYVTETIDKQGPLLKVLRLLSIYSLTADGIPPRVYEHFRNEIFQTYGYQYLFALNNLAALHLLKPQSSSISSLSSTLSSTLSSSSAFTSSSSTTSSHSSSSSATPSTAFKHARKPLRLWNSNVNEKDPDDISYVYSGYAPLSIRLVETADQWDEMASLLAFVGPHFRYYQEHNYFANHLGSRQDSPSFLSQLRATTMTLVFFIGGVTSTEISALRYLSRKTGHSFIVATTQVITGDSLLSSFMDSLHHSFR